MGVAPTAAFITVTLVALSACAEDPERLAGPRPQAPVRVMEYNARGHTTLGSDPARGGRVAALVSEVAPALIGLSECEPCQQLFDQMDASYELVTDGRVGVTAAYDPSLWRANDHGFLTLGQNDDGWGERVALWVEMEELASGAPLLLYSTHWCVPTRNPDDGCDLARHLEYAEQILKDARERASDGVPVLITGDFNVVEDRDEDEVLRAFAGAGYVDALRAIHPDEEIITLDGGFRVDYVYGLQPVEVIEAYVDDSIPFDLGSDHWPIISTLEFP